MSPLKRPSYLLLLDGSVEAQAAAQFALDLAKSTNAQIVAQHVIDTPAIWGQLKYNLPGLVGSGVYFEAQKKISEALRSLAETVVLAYRSQVEGRGLCLESYIDEGDTQTEICRRLQEHDVIIIGRMGNDESQSSLGLRVGANCQKPVIMIETGNTPRSGLHMSILYESMNSEVLSSIRAFAKSASIPMNDRLLAEVGQC